MGLPTHILLLYGYLLLFVWVLVEQLGFPLPATPVLLAAGALTVDGHLRFALCLLAGVAGSMLADSSWFLVGRRYGHYVLRILCKLSLEPTTCVRRTQDSFGRRRGTTLLFAKFIPGLGLLAPPVAGAWSSTVAPPRASHQKIAGASWLAASPSTPAAPANPAGERRTP